jgi:alginate export protein
MATMSGLNTGRPRCVSLESLSRFLRVRNTLTTNLACATLLTLAFVNFSFATNPPCPTATYRYLRYEEDYRYLRNPDCRTDPLDAIKFIALNHDGDWFLSLGGEVRENMEYFHNPTWGQEPQGSPYLLERYMGHVDVHLGERFRFFVQVKSGLENGRAGGPRIIDEDKLDLHQASLEVALVTSPRRTIALRVGRQELAFGARRFLSAREGPTVRQSFDGVRLDVSSDTWKLAVFATKPVQTNPGFFDDFPSPGQTSWGIYASRPIRYIHGSNLDLYYLGLDRTKSRFQQGVAGETRHSVGTRLWGQNRAWDYDVEPIYQWGEFGSGNIRAWAIETETGYTLRLPTNPRVALIADAASGDRDPKNSDLETFNPLFPRGLYYQLVNLNGHLNFFNLDPLLVSHINKNLSLTFDCGFFWRQSRGDGVYGVGGNFLRAGSSHDSRYIATQPSLVTEWRLQRHVTVIAIYTHSFPGVFLRETGPARSVNYVSVWLGYKF